MMVWPVMFAQYFGLGLMRPEMPGILLELFNGSMENVALYQGATDAVGALVAFALVPLIGDFSDEKGRKPALLISAICAAAPVFVLALYDHLLGVWPTIILYAAVALVSKLNSYSVALSYVADCSSIAQRSSVFGEVSGVMFVGLTAGPFVSGFLPRGVALLAAALLNVAAALYVVFLLPETLGRQQHKHHHQGSGEDNAKDPEKKKLLGASSSSFNGKKSYGADQDDEESAPGKKQKQKGKSDAVDSDDGKKQNKRGIWMAYNFLTQNRLFMLIGLITLVSQLAVFGVGQVYYLYLSEEVGFQRADTIRAALIGGIETSVVMLVGMPWLSNHMHESALMLIGLTSYLIYALGLAFSASSKGLVFAIIIFWALSGLTFPSTCSLLSAHTPSDQTGLAQGALSAVRCCASGLGPALFAVFFSSMVKLKHEQLGPQRTNFLEDTASVGWGSEAGVHYTALPFVLGALFISVSIVLALYLPATRLHPTKAAEIREKQQQDKEANKHNDEEQPKLKQEQQNGHGSPVSSDTSVDRADRWGFVRRRDGGHLIPAISGFHTFFDEFQHLSAHMRASVRRRRHHHDFMRHRKEEREKAQREAQEEQKQEEANKEQQQQQQQQRDDDDEDNNVSGSSSDSGSGSDGDEDTDSSKSKLTGDDGAFVMPPARSSKSRWTWLLVICAIVVGVMVLSKFIGHFTAPPPAHEHQQQSGKHGNALAEMNVVRSNATGDGTAPLSVRDWDLDPAVEGGSSSSVEDAAAAADEDDARPDVPSDMDEPADEEEESADERMHELSRYVAEKGKKKGSANMDKGSEKAAATGAAGPAAATSLNKKSRTASPRLVALSSSILAEQENHSGDNSTAASSDNDSGSTLKVKRINGIDDQNKKATPRKGAHPPAAKADTDHGEAQEKELHHELQKQIEQKKRIITVMALMGPPGVGKTALSRHLTAAYGLTPLSSGVLIRSEIARATPLGVQIKDIVASGGLVADELVLALVEKEIERLRTNNTDWPGVILDGFPRTLPQARMLDRPDCPIPPLSPMVYVHMKESILAERREGRRLCPVCGATYNMNPIDHDGYKLTPRVPDHADQTTCSRDNATLVRREDDKPEVAAHRMEAFRNESLPMARYYSAQGKLISIEKRFGAKKVFRAIRADIERLMAQQRLENERRAEERPQKLPEELDRQEEELKRVRGPESGLTGAGTEEEERTTQLVENDSDNDSSDDDEQDGGAKEEKKGGKDQTTSKKEEEKGEKEQQPTAQVQGKQRNSSGDRSKQPKAQEGA